ncbi:protein NinD [Pantoea sp. NGS-ED-1003]|uniref:protein NinD n=1 Tax=Pantoea sp. NGS-ED-1003 TaxID=1526743 RepID=UPI003510B7BE
MASSVKQQAGGGMSHKPHYRCDRCGMEKPPERYREGQPWWNKWCIRCEASPVGQFPIPETDEHRRKP